MSKFDVLLGRVQEEAGDESVKRAADGGLLEAFYQEAKKIAAEEGLGPTLTKNLKQVPSCTYIYVGHE